MHNATIHKHRYLEDMGRGTQLGAFAASLSLMQVDGNLRVASETDTRRRRPCHRRPGREEKLALRTLCNIYGLPCDLIPSRQAQQVSVEKKAFSFQRAFRVEALRQKVTRRAVLEYPLKPVQP